MIVWDCGQSFLFINKEKEKIYVDANTIDQISLTENDKNEIASRLRYIRDVAEQLVAKNKV